jgi:hypothetical protein
MQMLIISIILLKWISNLLARQCPSLHASRVVGIYTYRESPASDLKIESLKLLIENYFNLAIAVLVNIHVFYLC